MNQSMKERCELFIQNRDAIKGVYKWDGDNMAIMGSVIYILYPLSYRLSKFT